jgi:uracil-DNA glycosylase family 4
MTEITNLQTLMQEFRSRCDQSGLDFVCGADGTFFSQVAVIAEAPGPTEAHNHIPLSGGSGNLLWSKMRKHVGLTRKDCYVTNVCKRQVAFGEDIRKGIDVHELELWQQLLLWELGHLPNVRYVLVLGNYALNALTGHNGITQWRGSVLTAEIPHHSGGAAKRIVQVVCCNNPAFVLREPRLDIVFGFDIHKLKRVMDGEHAPPAIVTEMYPSVDRVERWCNSAVGTEDMVAYDIETIAGETACIGFARSTTEALCVAFRSKTEHVYSAVEERRLRRIINDFFHAVSVRFVAQFAAFDNTWMYHFDKIHVPRTYMDIMLAHHVLYPTLPHGLAFICSQYTDQPYYKDEKHGWRDGEDINTFWEYNGKDCCVTLACAFKLLNELRAADLEEFYFEHVMRLQPHLCTMTDCGLLIDLPLKERLREDMLKTISKLLDRFQDQVKAALGTDELYNPNSPKQMSDLYFSKLKLVGRGVRTDAENRNRMFEHPRTSEKAREIILTINEYAKEQKFYSTYVKSEVDYDGRMRCMWNQTGVQEAPGRLSSSQTMWGSGTNLQNQPERAYEMFIADQGYGFAYFDLSQAEARYVAWDAKIDRWMEQFERARVDHSFDAHRALAADMFKIAYDEVPTFDRYDSTKGHPPPAGVAEFAPTVRYIAKRCRHGLNYRMGPDRLSSTTGLPLLEATNAYRIYHRRTPELQQWWQLVEQEVRDTGMLFNALGRRWLLMERISNEALESIIAFKPQSTVGDWVSRVIYMSHDDPRWPANARMALNVHDALICLAPLDKLELCVSIALKYAGQEIMLPYKDKGVTRVRGLIIPSDAKISQPNERGFHSWGSLVPAHIEAAY